MSFGYTGQILKVDLSDGQVSIEQPDELFYRKYMGGSLLGAYYLLKEMGPGIDAFDPGNIIVFAPSVVTGCPIPGFSRYAVISKSPLTGGYGVTEAGGYWGPELKFAGFDAVVVKGKATRPVYLWIKDGAAEIRDASHIWGKTTKDAQDQIRDELDEKQARVALIGPAGENLVRFACIVNELKHFHGRCGLGAVMGSKNLKAIAVRGTKKIRMKDPDTVLGIARHMGQKFMDDPTGYRMYTLGTSSGVMMNNALGTFPTKNFRLGDFEDAQKISGETMKETILHGIEGCFACPLKCKRVVSLEAPYHVDPAFGGPEYESIGALGSLCCVSDVAAISKANEICAKNTLDTISTGVVIAFAMECYERGIITQEDTAGLDLRFGNAEVMVRITELIANRQSLGDLLAEGVLRAARKIGKGSERYAMHVKGQELPMHEPRGKGATMALAYATSPTGADHCRAAVDTAFENTGLPLQTVAPIGLLEPIPRLEFGPRKVRYYVTLEAVNSLHDTLGICIIVVDPGKKELLTFDRLVTTVEAVTGWQTSLYELMKIGERTTAMARAFNVREGFTAQDDTLPERFFEPLEGGKLKGYKVDRQAFDEALALYYEMKGWDENGRPRRGTLEALDVGWVADILDKSSS